MVEKKDKIILLIKKEKQQKSWKTVKLLCLVNNVCRHYVNINYQNIPIFAANIPHMLSQITKQVLNILLLLYLIAHIRLHSITCLKISLILRRDFGNIFNISSLKQTFKRCLLLRSQSKGKNSGIH